MARFKFAGVYLARKGDKLVAVPYADISIYLAGTDTPAVVYTSETGSYYISSAPQLNTNENGEFEFYVDDTDYDYTQKFKIVCSKPGYETKTWDYVSIFPYAGFDAHSIRDVNVVDNLSDVISTHDLLEYQGTQFVPENIDEILKLYYNPSPGEALVFDGTHFQKKPYENRTFIMASGTMLQTLPSDTYTVLKYNKIHKDSLGEWSGTSFKPQQSGLYYFKAQAGIKQFSPLKQMIIKFLINSYYRYGKSARSPDTVHYFYLDTSAFLLLNAGDVVNVALYHNLGHTGTRVADEWLEYLCIERVI